MCTGMLVLSVLLDQLSAGLAARLRRVGPADYFVEQYGLGSYWKANPADPADCRCSGHGACANGTRCHCAHGWGGVLCEFGPPAIYFEHDPYKDAAGPPPCADGRPADCAGARVAGWGVAPALYKTAMTRVGARLSVEVGVWHGASAIAMAGVARDDLKGGLVLAVDTWLGALEFWSRQLTKGQPDASRDLRWRNGYPGVYYTFLNHVVAKNVSRNLLPFPAPSRLAADLLFQRRVKVDFIHIDAAHEYRDVWEDIALWFRLLAHDGIMMGDDYERGWPGVVLAVNEFCERSGLELHRPGAGDGSVKWWVQKGRLGTAWLHRPSTIWLKQSVIQRVKAK